MNLGDLAARVTGAVLVGDASIAVRDVHHDSRKLGSGGVFVAVKGLVSDGNTFVDAALKKGAVAIVSEAEARPGVAWIRVPDARVALARMSAAANGDPASRLQLVGVTGTNGKTTTTWLIDAALRAAGHKVGVLGTVQYRIGDRLIEASRTTPESSDLQSLFRQMVQEGCSHAVLEVSSHSLDLRRVEGCVFKVAVFTNLTRDHLDFHGDMDRYFAAKRVLFDSLLDPQGRAVINAEDDRAPALVSASRGPAWTYAVGRAADIRADDISLSLDGTRFTVQTPMGTRPVDTPLLGRFNVQNVLAALGASLALGIDIDVALRGICSVKGVPGRLERVPGAQPFAIIVDYAHTDDALRNLLETVRELKPSRVITVFGCGGDRDRTKRPLMGAVASRLSDVVILTSDNPRSEPPDSIIEEIQRGMGNGRKAERHAIPDRREAIGRALQMAAPGDAVVIAGKGHETYQVLRDRTVPFDDRQVAQEALSRLAGSSRGKR